MINQMKSYVNNNHFYCICVVVALVMGFGFYASHYTFNIDMLVFEYYSGTALIEAGRFSAPLIHWFTNWMEFAPFWHTFAMGILLFVSGLAMSLVLKELSDNKISDSSLFVFWIFFATYPIIVYQLTYPILSVVLPYFLVSVAIWQLIPLIKGDRPFLKNILLAIGCLVISVDMYESHASVFLVLFFSGLLVRYLYVPSEKTKTIKYFIKSVVVACMILLVAIIIDFGVSKLVCYIACGTTEFWYSKNTTIAWLEDSVLDVIKWLYREILAQYVIAGVSNYSVWLFDVVVLVGGISSFIYSVKKRSLWCVLLYVATCVASLSLAIVRGSAPYYRMAQAISVLVAFFMMLVAENLKGKKLIKKVSICVFVILILNQTLIINRYSVINYQRHKYEQNIVVDIAKDLKKYPIEEKPVQFISYKNIPQDVFQYTPLSLNNPIADRYEELMCKFFDKVVPQTTFKRLDARYSGYTNGICRLNTSEGIVDFFNNYYRITCYPLYSVRDQSDHFLPEIYVDFDTNGCKLLVPEAARNSEKYDEIKEQYSDMPAYPYEGYIKELDDIILVKFYEEPLSAELE